MLDDLLAGMDDPGAHLRRCALDAHTLGLCVYPPRQDGSKAPDAATWTRYQQTRSTVDEISAWYANGAHTGLGLICGKVSGNLELFDLDDWDTYMLFLDAAERAGLEDLVSRVAGGYSEMSPRDGGGIHWLYRCPDATNMAPTKLAQRPSGDGKRQTLIETKGEGGYAVIAPTYGSVHPTGRPYTVEHGSLATIATITAAEREALFAVARTLDEIPAVEVVARRARQTTSSDELSPGDDFTARADWLNDVLIGWTVFRQFGEEIHVTYPGRPAGPGTSATINHYGNDQLIVHTTSTVFENPPKAYTKFSAYTLLHHGGDFTAAARELRARGYGSTREARANDEPWPTEPPGDLEVGGEPPLTGWAAHDAEYARDYDAEQAAEQAERPAVRFWTAAELAAADQTFTWDMRGILSHPTYGQIAGEKKTLKSYVCSFLDVAIATGIPAFGQFVVPKPGPVTIFVGEGGRIPYTRRMERISAAMGVKFGDIDNMQITFEVPRIGSTSFERALQDQLERRPTLIHIDPLYAYHPDSKDARNLFESGSMLSSISTPCMEAETNLIIANHYNKTGTGKGLDRITQAGSGEWCDSWILVSHRETPDIENGTFHLLLEIGSRQWGGAEWDLELRIGRFDPEMGEFDGTITWEIARHTATVSDVPKDLEKARDRIMERLTDEPWVLTKAGLYDKVKGNRDTFDAALDSLIRDEMADSQPLGRPEGGVVKTRTLYGLKPQHEPAIGQGWSGLAAE